MKPFTSDIPHPKPLPLPPLVSFNPKVCMDKNVHLPSTWRTGIGKLLTNRRIAEYQREGRYGTALKLPEIFGGTCVECGSTAKVRKLPSFVQWIPRPGERYCLVCRERYRSDHTKERDAATALRERVNKTKLELLSQYE